MAHVYMALERDADGYPPFDEEEIDATHLGQGRFRIDGIPMFVYGLSRADIVQVVRTADQKLWVDEVLEEAGHGTARVVPKDPDAMTTVAALFDRKGCAAIPTRYGLVAVDIPPGADSQEVLALLEQGQDKGDWQYDLGVAPGSS